MPNSPTDLITVRATARPKRVALLLNPRDLRPEEIDHITDRLSEYWGGALWPLIPTDGQSISDDWWTVLKAVDPDVVYAVGELSTDLDDLIARRVSPAVLKGLGSVESLRSNGRLHLTLSELTAMGVNAVVRHHGQRQTWGRAPLLVKFTESRDEAPATLAFVSRNFGVPSQVIGTLQAYDSAPHEDVPLGSATPAGLLDWWVEESHRQLTTARDLAGLYAPRPFDIAYDHMNEAFHLVVGDSVEDVLYAWNRQLSSNGHHGRDRLWLSTEFAEDRANLERIAKWIQRGYWSQPVGQVVVASYSLSLERLRSLADALRPVVRMACHARQFTPGAFPFPLGRMGYGLRSPNFGEGPRQLLAQVPMVEDAGLLPAPSPPFDISGSGREEWMVDCDIEYRLEPSRRSSEASWWRLPRRHRLGHLFLKRTGSRVNGGLLPTSPASLDRPGVIIEIPSKETLLHVLLDEPLPAAERRVRPEHRPTQAEYRVARPSVQGKRLAGLGDLLGGIVLAGEWFEDEFIRAVFTEGTGRARGQLDQLANTAIPELVELLRTPEAERVGVLSPESVARRIARLLLKTPPVERGFDERALSQLFGRLQGSTPDDQPNPFIEARDFNEAKQWQLMRLLHAGALLQGVDHQCPNCGLTTWHAVDQAGEKVQCPGCNRASPLALFPKWIVRVNSLITRAVARDGMVPVIEALHRLGGVLRSMYLIWPPQDLYPDFDADRKTDLDLICLRDGEFIVGEVKANMQDITDRVIDTQLSFARAVRPNRVVIAATGAAWESVVASRLDRLERELASLEIPLERMLLAW